MILASLVLQGWDISQIRGYTSEDITVPDVIDSKTKRWRIEEMTQKNEGTGGRDGPRQIQKRSYDTSSN